MYALFLPETSTQPESRASAPKDASSAASAAEWRALLRDRRWRALVISEVCARCGFAAKIASVPLIAAAVLPGGAAGAGLLLSAAGLSGLVGAPLGGLFVDRLGARATAIASGGASAAALLAVPILLSNGGGSAPGWLGDAGMSTAGAGFAALILMWSVGVAAQGPALVAIGQQLAPRGAQATALALPRAAGDGAYIFAPILLGLVADSALGKATPGLECAAAGALGAVGVLSLALLTRDDGGGSSRESEFK